MMRTVTKICTIALLMVVTACSTVPLTGRRQLSLVDDNTMQQQAAAAYRQLLSDPKTQVVRGTSQAQTVQNVGNKIARAVETYLAQQGYGDEYNFNWEFNLINDNQVNAWCMPGGKVAFYTGILPITQTDAGMATVMGHEIAHAIAKHSSERASNTALLQSIGVGLNVATANKSQVARAMISQGYGLGSQVALLKYSRNQESEADRMGLTFMAMAGYDPNEATGFWKRMAANAGGQKPPEFLSTHPSDERRIADIQKLIPEAMKYYKK